jgi:RNA polymerase sigma factor (sigma-70 family)
VDTPVLGDGRDLIPVDVRLGTLYRVLAPFLAHFLDRLRVPERDSPDVAQDVWLVVLRQAVRELPAEHALHRWLRGDPDAESHMRRWVGSIAYHVVLNYRTRGYRRREKLSPEGVVHMVSRAPGPARQLADAERCEGLLDLLDQLPEARRTVVVMHYFEGRTAMEIARELSIPEGSVFSRIRQARLDLKAIAQRTARSDLHLMLDTQDVDVVVAGNAPGAEADGDSAALHGSDGTGWPPLLALLLLLGARRMAAPAGLHVHQSSRNRQKPS